MALAAMVAAGIAPHSTPVADADSAVPQPNTACPPGYADAMTRGPDVTGPPLV